jgi:hypothetical protein
VERRAHYYYIWEPYLYEIEVVTAFNCWRSTKL